MRPACHVSVGWKLTPVHSDALHGVRLPVSVLSKCFFAVIFCFVVFPSVPGAKVVFQSSRLLEQSTRVFFHSPIECFELSAHGVELSFHVVEEVDVGFLEGRPRSNASTGNTSRRPLARVLEPCRTHPFPPLGRVLDHPFLFPTSAFATPVLSLWTVLCKRTCRVFDDLREDLLGANPVLSQSNTRFE